VLRFGHSFHGGRYKGLKVVRIGRTFARFGAARAIATRFRWRPACRVCSRPVTCAITPSNEYRVEWAKAAWPLLLSFNTWPFPCQKTISGIISAHRTFYKGEKAFMLCAIRSAKPSENGGRLLLTAKFQFRSDHKSPDYPFPGLSEPRGTSLFQLLFKTASYSVARAVPT
jgi:hypothetical protein